MPQIITDINDAMDALKRLCAPNTDPVLDEANELMPILQSCQRASIWVASTAYYLGAVVQPTASNRNGHRFELVAFDGSGVTSGSTEPSWPSSDNASVSDGNCTWQEVGTDYANLWDLRQAAFLAWQMKADKATACGVDFQSASGASVSQNQLIMNLERQRDRYAPIYVA